VLELMICLCWMKTRKVLGRGHCLKLRWNLLDQWTVDAPSLNALKNSLSRIRDKRMGFFMDWVRKVLGLAGGWSRREAAQGKSHEHCKTACNMSFVSVRVSALAIIVDIHQLYRFTVLPVWQQ